MKSIGFFLLASLLACNTFAQSTFYWVGGTPGAESAWEIPSNWYPQFVPDADSRVIIEARNDGHNAMPVIKHDEEVGSVIIRHGGKLTISAEGTLWIMQDEIEGEGIQWQHHDLANLGTIWVKHTDTAFYKRLTAASHQNGKVIWPVDMQQAIVKE